MLITSLTFSQTEKRVALVIGNAEYKGGSILKNPVNDANLMATTLKGLGFEVIKKNNADKASMEQALYQFALKAENASVMLLYYAGHGIQVGADPYLVPIGADPPNETAVKFQCINIKEMLGNLEFYEDNLNIVILDACRNNPFRSWKRSGRSGFNAPPQPNGTIIAYATDEGQAADDNPNESNGLYTQKLVEQLQQAQSIRQVFYKTRDAVSRATDGQQLPMFWDKTNGEFFLKTPSSDAPVVGEVKTLATYGSIELTTEIAGDLYLDGQRLSKVQADAVVPINKVKTGEHTLEIRGVENWSGVISVKKSQTVQIKAQRKKTLASVKTTDKNEHNQVEEYTDSTTGMKFTLIKAGSFMMGSPENESGRKKDEAQHNVTISKDYFMGIYEVTQSEWEAIMGDNPSWNYKCSKCPVEKVSWEDAQTFVKKMNSKTKKGKYRLPTEAEWEYAARAGTKTTFHTGRRLEKTEANISFTKGKTVPVGSYTPNHWGLYDMYGNVFEWCSDWYGTYDSTAKSDPKGPDHGSERVHRGGSWNTRAYLCRSANRLKTKSTDRVTSIGIRLVYIP